MTGSEQLSLGETDGERKAGVGRKGLETEEVRKRLRVRHEYPEWLFFEEVPFHDDLKHTQRLADAIALPTYQSRGYELHGFEIKVTRADWQKELKDGAKAEAVAKHCDRFWIVLGDAGIATDEEVPPDWGVIVPHGDTLRARRQAKPLRDVRGTWPRELLVTLARKSYKNAADRASEGASQSYHSGYDAGLQAARREAGNAPAKVEAYDKLVAALEIGRWSIITDNDIQTLVEHAKAGRALHGGFMGPDYIARELRNVAIHAKEQAERLEKAIKEHGDPPA